MGSKLDFTLAILNGAIGDHLVATKNGLATELACMHEGAPFPMTRAALATALPSASAKVVLLVHGLMCTEEVWKLPDGTDYGTLLERDLGYTALRLRYNSGRAIVENGEALARLLEELADAYPVPIEELVLLGYSMGGLVVRSACHVGKLEDHHWLALVRRAIYVGTPHRGAPLERAGKILTRVLRAIPDPYTRLIADIVEVRSMGIKDLGEGICVRDMEHPVPLLPEIRHYLAAGSLVDDPNVALFFGDVMVPVQSATDHRIVDREGFVLPPEHVKLFPHFSHVRLAHDALVYDQIRTWCE